MSETEKQITMNDIQRAVAQTSQKDFIEFGIRDYKSLRQRVSRLVGRLRGKHVWTYQEYMKELTTFSKFMYPFPKE